MDRDLDGDVDVMDRVIENEMSGGAKFDFGLDGTSTFNSLDFGRRTTQLIIGGFTIATGIVKIAAGIIVVGSAAAEATSLFGMALIPHTLGIGGILIASGFGAVGFGLYLTGDALREKKP